jgi:hypothetical protein
MTAKTPGRPRALAAIQRLRDMQREHARLEFVHALDRQRSAQLEHRAADDRRTDEAADAGQAFRRQPDVQARTRWLEHLQGLEEQLQNAGRRAAAAASAADAQRRAVIACDARLKAAQALGAKLDEDRERVRRRRAARESDALWLVRRPSEEAAC